MRANVCVVRLFDLFRSFGHCVLPLGHALTSSIPSPTAHSLGSPPTLAVAGLLVSIFSFMRFL